MNDKPDPYEWADGLLRIANDVSMNITSLTISDITQTLQNTAKVLADLADDYHSLRTKTEVFLEIDGERIDLSDLVPQDLYKEYVRQYIVTALGSNA